MRTLTNTLRSAQNAASRQPYLRVQARNTNLGIVNLKWTRIYAGTEEENQHALTLAGDGSLIRVRISSATDNLKLYRQRIARPLGGSGFNQWVYLDEYNIKAATVCSLGAEISLIFARANGEIYRYYSPDYGVNWEVEFAGYTTTGVNSLAAAHKPNGDLAIFIANEYTLYLIKRLSGIWQSCQPWTRSAGGLSGAAAVYADGDWKLMATGRDTDGNQKAWTLIYGDGGEVSPGNWTDLKVLASAPADSHYEFSRPFLDKPDDYRLSFLEKYSGSEAYKRTFFSSKVKGTYFLDNRWKEPCPFDSQTWYPLPPECSAGIALGHYGDYAWAGCAAGLWIAYLEEQTYDLTGDILSAQLDLSEDGGQATVELRQGSGIDFMEEGNELLISPGYRTPAGKEYSQGLSFVVQSQEYTSAGGKTSTILQATDGWTALERWTARSQLRWNMADQNGAPFIAYAVRAILEQVLDRAGLKLEIISHSDFIQEFFPDFTIHPGENGKNSVKRLLSFVPDLLFIEGNTAYLVNPLATDTPVYYYGLAPGSVPTGQARGPAPTEAYYRDDSWNVNRVLVEGKDPYTGEAMIAESFNWSSINKNGDRLETIEDENIRTAAQAHKRGAARLRKAEIYAGSGYIREPVNCGLQLYDVIEISDPRAGLMETRRRVLGIRLTYRPARAEYEQRVEIGGV
jgi:hypothetical protein